MRLNNAELPSGIIDKSAMKITACLRLGASVNLRKVVDINNENVVNYMLSKMGGE